MQHIRHTKTNIFYIYHGVLLSKTRRTDIHVYRNLASTSNASENEKNFVLNGFAASLYLNQLLLLYM